MEIKAVGFDIDGTLYRNMMMYICSTPSFIKHPVLVSHFSKARKEIRNIRPIDDFRKVQTSLISASMGIPEDRVEAMIEKRLYKDWEETFKCIRPVKGVRQTLEKIKELGLGLGALSDFPVQNKLKYLGLDGYWDCEFTSEETGYLKPHPESFLLLAERLGVKPEEILYVGNSYSKDVEGAAAVGMKTAHFSLKKKDNSIADITFGRYSELYQYLCRLEKR